MNNTSTAQTKRQTEETGETQTGTSALTADDPPRKIQITTSRQHIYETKLSNWARICEQILSNTTHTQTHTSKSTNSFTFNLYVRLKLTRNRTSNSVTCNLYGRFWAFVVWMHSTCAKVSTPSHRQPVRETLGICVVDKVLFLFTGTEDDLCSIDFIGLTITRPSRVEHQAQIEGIDSPA